MYEVTSYLMLIGASQSSIADAKHFEIRALGTRDLRSLALLRTSGFVRSDRGPKQINLLGANFSIRAADSPGEAVWATPLVISFLLPRNSEGAQYRIMHLGPGGAAWNEMESFFTPANGSSLCAKIGEGGTYALARIEQ
jgi:hypothetical protein